MKFLLSVLLFFGAIPCGWSQIMVNPSIPIRYEIQLEFVVVKNSDGDEANSLGSASERTYIAEQMNRVLGQFGTQVKFPDTDQSWEDDYAYEGEGSGTRRTSDLGWIFNNIPEEFYQPAEGVITVVFCERTPGFGYRGFYQTNGYAYIGGNGVTFFLGDGMLQNNGNMDIVAGVLAHEIGHNLGLTHVNDEDNLMNSTIYEGYMENNQTAKIYNERFERGFLAELGPPEIRIAPTFGGQFRIEFLRAAQGPLQLTSSEILDEEEWNSESSALLDGIYRSDGAAFDFAAPARNFFRAEPLPANFRKNLVLEPKATRVSAPTHCESCGCCAVDGSHSDGP